MDNLVSSSQNPSTTKDVAVNPADHTTAAVPATAVHGAHKAADGIAQIDADLAQRLDKFALEAIVELKISRFLDQIGSYYPEDLHSLIMKKVEKPLLGQILRRTGGNQVHASKILGINRNTLRKKMKLYGFSS